MSLIGDSLNLNNRWLKPMLILILILVFLGIVSSFIGGNEDTDSATSYETIRALETVIDTAKSQFTALPVPRTVLNIRGSWLDGSEDDPFAGPEQAEIIIVEFSDFQCPFCKLSFPAIREVISKYENIKFIYRDFPVEEIHPDALRAAFAAQCAYEQEKFWPFHDRLFQNQDDLSETALIQYAKQSGIEVDSFSECLKSERYRDEVEDDYNAGIALGVRGTPTWFINGQKLEGSLTQDMWERILSVL